MTRKRVDPGTQLAGCPPNKTYFELPFPIDERLDLLTDAAKTAGYPATRKDLVSALILEATEEGDKLVALLTRFGSAKAEQAAVESRPDVTVLVQKPRKPGRRRRE